MRSARRTLSMRQTHPRPASAIRAEMARSNTTQHDVARRLGISQAAVSRRLRGEIPFDADELIALADMLGVTIASLFGEDVAA